MTQQKVPHKHAELIKLWADGAIIQWFDDREWEDCHNNLPTWTPKFKYRVKPEPKPDTVKIRRLTYNGQCDCVIVESVHSDFANVRLVFDGETGALKDAQVLAKE